MVATVGGVLAAAGARFIVSQQVSLPATIAVTYNLLDMVVSALVIDQLSGDGGHISVQVGLAGRISGLIVGMVVTSLLCGPINLFVAVALNVTSLAVGMIIKNATENRDALIV